jgi:hypothetical protein
VRRGLGAKGGVEEGSMRLVLCLLVCGAVVAAGCGSKKTYSTPAGDVTVERKGEQTTATVKTEQGTATVQVGSKAEAEVGLVGYPGAQAEQNVTWKGEQEGEKLVQVHLTTPDSFDQVKAFYQKQYPDAEVSMSMSTPELQTVQLIVHEQDVRRVVTISRKNDEDKTTILLQRVEQ